MPLKRPSYVQKAYDRRNQQSRNSSSQETQIIDVDRDNALREQAKTRPGIYRLTTGEVLISSLQEGSSYVSASGKTVRVKTPVATSTTGKRIYAEDQVGGSSSEGVRGFNLGDPRVREYLGFQAGNKKDYPTTGSIFAEARANESRAANINYSENTQETASTPIGTVSRYVNPSTNVVVKRGASDYLRGKADSFANTLGRNAYAIERDAPQSGIGKYVYAGGAGVYRAGEGLLNEYAERPQNIGRQVSISYAGGTVFGIAGGSTLNAVGTKWGVSAFNKARYAMWGIGGAATAASVYGKSAGEIGASLPGFVAAGVGFSKGYSAANPGLYVRSYRDTGKPLIAEGYKTGDTWAAIGKQNGEAIVSAWGKDVKIGYQSRTIIGATKGKGNVWNVDATKYAAVNVGRDTLPLSGQFTGKIAGRVTALQSGTTQYVGYTGKQKLFMSDSVTDVYKATGGYSVLEKGRLTRSGTTNTLYSKYDYTARYRGLYTKTSIKGGYADILGTNYKTPYSVINQRKALWELTNRKTSYTSQRTYNTEASYSRTGYAGAYPKYLQRGLNLLAGGRSTRSVWASRQGSVMPRSIVEEIPISSQRGGFAPQFAGMPFKLGGTARAPLFGVLGSTATNRKPVSNNLLSPSMGTVFKINSSSKNKSFLGVDVGSASVFKPRQEDNIMPKLDIGSSLIQRQTRNTVPRVPSENKQRVPPFVPPLVIPVGIPMRGGREGRGARSRSFEYRPDITSSLFNITGNAPSNLTGLELRPLLGGRKKKRKKAKK